jgi:hypothetical protein
VSALTATATASEMTMQPSASDGFSSTLGGRKSSCISEKPKPSIETSGRDAVAVPSDSAESARSLQGGYIAL